MRKLGSETGYNGLERKTSLLVTRVSEAAIVEKLALGIEASLSSIAPIQVRRVVNDKQLSSPNTSVGASEYAGMEVAGATTSASEVSECDTGRIDLMLDV